MKLQRWVKRVGAMTSADLESMRREYDSYRGILVAHIQTKLGPMSKTTKQLTACNGVLSFAQTALDALKGVREGMTVADFEASHPTYDLAGPTALNLQRWTKLGGIPDIREGPPPPLNL